MGDSGSGDVVGERHSMSEENALDSVVLGDLGLTPAFVQSVFDMLSSGR